MEINSQLPKTSLYNLLNNQTSKDQNLTAEISRTQNPKQKKSPETLPQEIQTPPPEDIEKRQTYGLLVLELMSNDEYDAFKRATAGMSEGDKMLAAQSLYSLTNFYNGKYNSPDHQQALKPSTPYEKNAQKAFGIQMQNLDHFLQRYKNAYNTLQKVDITL
ncbi:hypothetical protein [Helicobacter sp. 11S03491-1]|uniref:hypothetical protein n=1 Tax=Helicobacter sp. 11S03491-1 TaxID=1476196 RepID=UPI000BD65682|nr:hypothetical protein [Helicobacter sp. 11S03491-1]PAF43298.1 hypothetical protein BKH45_01275 [Helicobacter sp. 11S03491-1]